MHDLTSGTVPPPDAAAEETEIGLLSLPEDVALLERLRASAYAGLPNLTRVPTDVFVWRASRPGEK